MVTANETKKIEHAVVILATGAIEQKPQSYGYGKNKNVVTQLELSEMIGKDELDIPENGTVVMIQCVEQRDEKRAYCSRICCATAVKNAVSLKEKYSDLNIIVLYRDMRTYGFSEIYYKQAREKGILFIKYDTDKKPDLTVEDDKINIKFRDTNSNSQFNVNPNMVVLSVPIIPRSNKEELSELLRVPLNEDGFFVEAHVKLRPVDFASEGLFLCGTVHAPKFIQETIAQANAVAGRAASVLTKNVLPVSGQTAFVDQDKCISCMTCVHLCPYNAPWVNKNNKAEIQAPVCMGCGSCTAECPARAITLRCYTDNQIVSALDSLFLERSASTDMTFVYPEKVGVTPPKWFKKEV